MRNRYFRKSVIISIVALVVMVLMLLMVPGITAEDPDPAPELPLDYVGISSDLPNHCVMLDRNESPSEVFISSQDAKIEGENGTNGTILLQCEYTIDPNASYSAVKWNFDNTNRECKVLKIDPDDPTNSFGSSTDDWTIIASPGGNIKLTCHFGDQFD